MGDNAMSEAQQARERLGLTLPQAARQASVSLSYLRRIEAHGGAPYGLAERLSRIYDVSVIVFM